ncbi:MAG: putative membrane protein [Alphaproteobacteria bacterium]|jgi:uncharacterized membrane protein
MTKPYTPNYSRNHTLDIVRTFAIVLMVIFHFIYDVKFFGYVDWDTPDGFGWQQFRWVIISLFFLCLGISLTFAHKHSFRKKKFLFRVSQIAFAALIISVATYFALPKNWIFFGVLHFLAFASCIVVWFVKMPKISLCIGLTFFLIGALQLVPVRWPFHLLSDNLPSYTNDYVAIVPWLGMVFLGITIAHTKWFIGDPLSPKSLNAPVDKQVNSRTWLIWPGQHSLSIYLLHQPIMMAALYLISSL